MKINIESPPRIYTSWKEEPLTPSTFIENRESAPEPKLIDEMLTPFLSGLNTRRRAVGVPRSVNTVSKLTVSVEKRSLTDDDVVKSSEMQDCTITETSIANMANRRYRILRNIQDYLLYLHQNP